MTRAAPTISPPPAPESALSFQSLFKKHRDAPADFLLAQIERAWLSGAESRTSNPMGYAAACLRADLIEPLALLGAEVNPTQSHHTPALYHAINAMNHDSDPACAMELLRLGADWSARLINGETVAQTALEKSRPAMRALISYGVPFDHLDQYDNPLLCSVASRLDIDRNQALLMLNLLLELGAPVESKNKYGETALFCACQSASPLCAQALLAAGANPNVQSVDGVSPLIAALEGSGASPNSADLKARVVAILLAARADPRLESIYGVSALSMARSTKDRKGIETALDIVLSWEQAGELDRALKSAPLKAPRPGL